MRGSCKILLLLLLLLLPSTDSRAIELPIFGGFVRLNSNLYSL